MLAGDIVAMRIKTDEPFPSADSISKRFGVSRTVAREAVQTLVMLGLVRVSQGRRAEILGAEEWDVLSPVVQEALRREHQTGSVISELYEIRMLLEPPAAAWMATRGGETPRATLVAQSDHMQQLATDGTLHDFMALDREFHNTIARGSGNRVLAAVRRDIAEVLATLWSLSNLTARGMAAVSEQHAQIARAISSGDDAEAYRTMKEHLGWAAGIDLGQLTPIATSPDRGPNPGLAQSDTARR